MDSTRKIKVLIIDDHPMVRRGLKILLDNFEDFETVADTADGRIALTLCDLFQPGVQSSFSEGGLRQGRWCGRSTARVSI